MSGLRMYRTSVFSIKVEEYVVDNVTNHFIDYAPFPGHTRREVKRAETHQWFETEDDAYTFLMERETLKLEALRRQIEKVKSNIGNISGEAMKSKRNREWRKI